MRQVLLARWRPAASAGWASTPAVLGGATGSTGAFRSIEYLESGDECRGSALRDDDTETIRLRVDLGHWRQQFGFAVLKLWRCRISATRGLCSLPPLRCGGRNRYDCQ